MMNRTLLALMLSLAATPAFAQERGRNTTRIPPGHMPPDGLCRVWYEGVPPGRQPQPTTCSAAERVASRDRDARVIYGARQSAPVYRDGRGYPGDVWRDDDRRAGADGRRPNPGGQNRAGRAVPRGDRYPGNDPYARHPEERGGYRYESEAFRLGHEDGVQKGREDARDRDSFDPARHSWYRNADRGYNSRYGSREDFRTEYRRGFLAGYETVHGDRQGAGSRWWPF
jgi:hypothetical protein